MKLRLASYNIQYGRGKDDRYDIGRIVDEIGEQDLVAVQEVERNASRNGYQDQPAEIAARLDQMHWVYGPGIDLDASDIVDGKPTHRRRQFGNMVLSRWPIVSVIHHTLPKIGLARANHLQRILTEAVIDAPFGPIRFLSTHLEHVSPMTRMPQVAYMKELLLRGHERGASFGTRDPDSPWLDRPAPPQPMSAIVMGDMNFEPNGPEYVALCGDWSNWDGRVTPLHGLVDAWVAAGNETETGNTLPRPGRDFFRIDHCFVTTDLAHAVTRAWIGTQAMGSDHNPIFVEMEMDRLDRSFQAV